jgi:serine/threonine kinase 32
MVCMHAISSALEPVSTQRMGSASWESFTDNPFFREIDFEALLRKEIEPIFVPSSEKRNFDATYDLEELLLEEAPLEARARRQKPREPLKEGATDKEIRTDELYRLIETHFKPFDYTVAAYKRYGLSIQDQVGSRHVLILLRYTNSAPNELPCLTLGASNLEPISRSESPSSTFQPGQAMPYGSSSRTDTPATQTSTRPSPMAGSLSAFHPQRNPANRTGQLDHVSTTDTAGSEDSHWQPKQYTTGSLQHSAVRQIGGNQKHGRPGSSNNLVLDGTESWSDLAVKDTTLPADAKEGLSSTGEKKKEGMLGFFRSKKGRGASPKPMERGVLSVKDGGRVVVGHN